MPEMGTDQLSEKKTGLYGENLVQTHYLMSIYQIIFGMPCVGVRPRFCAGNGNRSTFREKNGIIWGKSGPNPLLDVYLPNYFWHAMCGSKTKVLCRKWEQINCAYHNYAMTQTKCVHFDASWDIFWLKQVQ